jgi:hypothetical protein
VVKGITYINIYIKWKTSAITNDEILSHTNTWIEVDIIMLGKMSPAQKDKYFMISLMWGIKLILPKLKYKIRDCGE